MEKEYQVYRKIRSDSNSFYRSVFFRYFEHLVNSKDKVALKKFEDLIIEGRLYLLQAGYDDDIIDAFEAVKKKENIE